MSERKAFKAFKEYFDAALVRQIAAWVADAEPRFARTRFLQLASYGLDGLDLHHHATTANRSSPTHRPLRISRKASGESPSSATWPRTEWVSWVLSPATTATPNRQIRPEALHN